MIQVINGFLDELRNKEEIRGLLIFGSYARGDQRDNSDIDILALVEEGAWRDVETRGGKKFELVYASLIKAKEFYEENPNDAVQQWSDGKIVYDKDGKMEELKSFVFNIRDKGKLPLNQKQIEHLKFDKEDKIRAVENLIEKDFPTANLYLQMLGQEMMELYFDLTQQWTPAPKQRIPYLRKNDKEIAELFETFYQEKEIESQLKVIKKLVMAVFSKRK